MGGGESMSIEVESDEGGLVVIKISGTLTKEELDRAQTECEESIERAGRIGILVVAKDFAGWDQSDNWEEFDITTAIQTIVDNSGSYYGFVMKS